MTNLKPSQCPNFIINICPICGILVGGHVQHPDAQGVGIGLVMAELDREAGKSEDASNRMGVNNE